MFEETNQTEETIETTENEVELPDTFLSDEETMPEAEETTEESAEVEPEEKEPPVEEVNPDEREKQAQTYKIKHLGEEKELTLDELITAAQKGADYDRIRGNYDKLRESRALTTIERLAKDAGMTADEYVEIIEGSIKQSSLEGRAGELTAQGYSEEAAKQIAELEYNNSLLQTKQQAKEKEAEAQLQKEQLIKDDLTNLLRLYPEVTELPHEVIKLIDTGLMPTAAYQKYLLEQKELKIKQLEQNKKNKQTSPGSLQNNADVKEDLFLSGFLD